MDHQEHAIGIFRELAVPRGEAIGLLAVGAVYRDLGPPARALAAATRALARGRARGARGGGGDALLHLALANDSAGRYDEAEEQATRAVGYAEDIGDESLIVEAHHALAEVRRHQGRLGDAVQHLQTALRIAGRAEYRSGQLKALVGLAACSVQQHRQRDALAYGRRAVTLSRAGGYRLVEGQARALLDTIR
jgi:tetratricopeptide (TPR) repeat protein